MNYDFFNLCKDTAQSSYQDTSKQAYEQLVNGLFRKNIRGKEKTHQLDEYDGETLVGNTTLIPGNIYMFVYKAENPAKFSDGQIEFEYYDNMPVVLVTHTQEELVRGINLNLCNSTLRAFVINALHNLDPQFYKRGNIDMAYRGQMPISKNVIQTFTNQELEKQFYEYIKNECHLQNTGILFRHYNMSRMQRIRLVEIWQHQLVPFLEYRGEIKQEILSLIWKVTGIDSLKF